MAINLKIIYFQLISLHEIDYKVTNPDLNPKAGRAWYMSKNMYLLDFDTCKKWYFCSRSQIQRK